MKKRNLLTLKVPGTQVILEKYVIPNRDRIVLKDTDENIAKTIREVLMDDSIHLHIMRMDALSFMLTGNRTLGVGEVPGKAMLFAFLHPEEHHIPTICYNMCTGRIDISDAEMKRTMIETQVGSTVKYGTARFTNEQYLMTPSVEMNPVDKEKLFETEIKPTLEKLMDLMVEHDMPFIITAIYRYVGYQKEGESDIYMNCGGLYRSHMPLHTISTQLFAADTQLALSFGKVKPLPAEYRELSRTYSGIGQMVFNAHADGMSAAAADMIKAGVPEVDPANPLESFHRFMSSDSISEAKKDEVSKALMREQSARIREMIAKDQKN